MRNVADKFAEKMEINLLCSKNSFTLSSVLCDMRKTALKPDSPQRTVKNGACLLHAR
jgi:hypothetical protein